MASAAMQRSLSAWFVRGALAAALSAAACGDDPKEGPAGSKDDPFGNAPSGDPFNGSKAGSGAGSGSSMGGSSAVGSGGPNCPSGIARTSRVTPRVILVLDGSCSMSTNYPANGSQSASSCTNNPNSRWSALHDVLLGNNGVVRQLQGVVEFGVTIFGTTPKCPIAVDPIDPAVNNFDAINNAFPANAPPGMFTPTGPALDFVYENMIDRTSGPDQMEGPQIVLLATDGEPNSCDNAQTNYRPSVEAVRKGADYGAQTYVVSLADANGQFHDHLQELANIGNGGQGKLYTPGSPAELRADLELLIGGAVGCDIALNGTVRDGEECKGVVKLNDQMLECNGNDGWVLTDRRHIRLQGSACDKLKATPNAVLSANFPCGIFMVQ